MSVNSMIAAAIPVARGCGSRTQNGAYWECGIDPMGSGITEFLFDPPIPVPEELLARLPHQGVQLFEQGGVTHLLDRVGLSHYPNVADIIEEARRFGLSRRLPKTLPFERLTADSRLVLVHDRGYVENFQDYPDWHCPKCIAGHLKDQQPHQCCAGVWWQDLHDAPGGQRKMPSFRYSGTPRPTNLSEEYIPAFVASFPASRLVVVRGDNHSSVRDKLKKSTLPVAEVDQ